MTNLVYTRSAELLEAEINDELVGLHPEAGQCFGFNEVATFVWRRLDRPRTFDELRDELFKEFDVGSDQCTRELHDLLDDLIDKGLVARTTV